MYSIVHLLLDGSIPIDAVHSIPHAAALQSHICRKNTGGQMRSGMSFDDSNTGWLEKQDGTDVSELASRRTVVFAQGAQCAK
jgi:hypothetical protein